MLSSSQARIKLLHSAVDVGLLTSVNDIQFKSTSSQTGTPFFFCCACDISENYARPVKKCPMFLPESRERYYTISRVWHVTLASISGFLKDGSSCISGSITPYHQHVTTPKTWGPLFVFFLHYRQRVPNNHITFTNHCIQQFLQMSRTSINGTLKCQVSPIPSWLLGYTSTSPHLHSPREVIYSPSPSAICSCPMLTIVVHFLTISDAKSVLHPRQ